MFDYEGAPQFKIKMVDVWLDHVASFLATLNTLGNISSNE